MSGSLRLRYAATTVAVECADRGLRDWLVEFLMPAFELAGAEPPHHAIRIDGEARERRRLETALARAPHAVFRQGFGFDGHFSEHATAVDAAGRLVARDAQRDAFYAIDGPDVHVAIEAGPAARLLAMRVVREFATSAQLRLGRLPLHASAFVDGGLATLVCGPKRSGKTSLLIHALRCGHGFLSNDRVFASVSRAPRARAMPTIVMLRDGTLRHFPALAEAFERAAFDRARTLAECAPGIARPTPRAGSGFDRPGISPAQLCRLLGAPMWAEAPVGRLLFPEIDAGVRGLCVEPLTASEATQRLGRALLVSSHPTRSSELFAGGPRVEVSPGTEASRCAALAARVPAYRCRLGPHAFERDLREALADLPATPPPPTAPSPGSAAP